MIVSTAGDTRAQSRVGDLIVNTLTNKSAQRIYSFGSSPAGWDARGLVLFHERHERWDAVARRHWHSLLDSAG